MDPERLIQCPLVKHHWIRARRFPYHLVKCKESNPEIAKKLATCPFNARHLVPQADLSNHIMKCNDKAFVEQDVGCSLSPWDIPCELLSLGAWQMCWSWALCQQNPLPLFPFQSVVRVWGRGNKDGQEGAALAGKVF
uniref:Gametocyte specific factor 1 n=1 Tax=Junco hyemalis TaxID=40217 RepID=A0A8C5IXX5_JUNHY